MQVQLTLNGEKEVGDVFTALSLLVADIRSKKAVSSTLVDALSSAVTIATEGQALVGDVTSDPLGSLNSAFVGGQQIYAALKG